IISDVWTPGFALLWHLEYRGAAAFDGHDVRVPWDMWAYHPDEMSLAIIREAPKVSFVHFPSALMVISRGRGRPTDMARDYDEIARANQRVPAGYRQNGTRQFPTAKGSGYCWELMQDDGKAISVSCWFDKETLGASYGGSPVYREAFYKVLAAI